MSGTRRWLALTLVIALTVPGGPLIPISATASGAATPTVGGAGGLSGFPTPQVATSSSTPTVVNTSTGGAAGSSSFSSTNALIIVIGAVAVLLGISYFIWRDARRRAPVREAAGTLGEGRGKPGSKPPPKPRKLSPAERRRRKRGRAKR